MAINFEALKDGGLHYVLLKLKTVIDNLLAKKVNNTDYASDSTYGIVKLNSAEGVTLNASGQLDIGGRLGQYPNGGVYYPVDIRPSGVGTSAFLMTDGAKDIKAYARTFAILAGAGITCKSAPAGSTQYRISNSQANRFLCAALKGGRLATNQSAAITDGTAFIESIKFANGNDVSAYFGATETNNDIIITVSRSVNPDAATTTLRGYGTNANNDNILVGQGVGASNGKAISLGQSTYAGGNQTMALGNAVHVMANNSVGMGHTLLVNKQYCLGTGQGHDFTNATNGTTAVGTWSDLTSTTKFAVGVGTAYNVRKNIFEVRSNSGASGLVLLSPNGTKYQVSVSDAGALNVEKLS